MENHDRFIFDFCFEKERKEDEEENERGRDRERRLRAANPKSLLESLSDLNQAACYHLALVADESLTDDCESSPMVSRQHIWLPSARWSRTAWFKSDKISKIIVSAQG